MNAFEKIYYLFETELFQECLELCDSEIKKLGNVQISYYPWFYRGKVEYENGEFDKAITSFERVLLLSPNEDQVWVSMACAFEAKKDTKHAFKAYLKEVRLFPNNCFGWQKLAGFLVRSKRFYLAKKIFGEVFSKGAFDYTVSAAEYAEALYECGTLEEELEYFECLIKQGFDEDWIKEDYLRIKKDMGLL